MPRRYDGPVEVWWAKLESSGRRCDGNRRTCTRPAVNEYTVIRTHQDGNVVEGAERENKRACALHRREFVDSVFWRVMADREVEKEDPTTPEARKKRQAWQEKRLARRAASSQERSEDGA